MLIDARDTTGEHSTGLCKFDQFFQLVIGAWCDAGDNLAAKLWRNG